MTEEANRYYSEEGYQLRAIMLVMEKGNEVAREFYTSVRFEEIACINGLYPHGDGAIWIRHV